MSFDDFYDVLRVEHKQQWSKYRPLRYSTVERTLVDIAVLTLTDGDVETHPAPVIPYDNSSRFSEISWSTVSNAALRSSSTRKKMSFS